MFQPNAGGTCTSTITTSTTSGNAALPAGGGNEVALINNDAANSAYVEFGDAAVVAKAPANGGAAGSMLLPAAMKQPIIVTLPTFVNGVAPVQWAAVADAGTPKVYLTRGTWKPS